MNGWAAAFAAALVLLILALMGGRLAHVRRSRRQREIARDRPALSLEAFQRHFAVRDVPPEVGAWVFSELGGYYAAGLSPDPCDRLFGMAGIDREELEFIVERAFEAMALPMPSPTLPEAIPALETVGDLVVYLARRQRGARA